MLARVASPRTQLLATRYELLEIVGSGANALVWRALDLATGGEVAVKRLRADRALVPEWQARLRREARTVATLRHPGIVRVIELGEDGAGAPYLVMELLEGETLRDALAREGSFAAERAIAVTCELLEALEAVHAGGVVHRDVKPDNVFVVRAPEERVALLDFGLARLIDGGLALTRDGTRVGTPLYMSPEQARGVPRIDARADVWGAGSVLYELVTGVAPFRAATPLQVMHAVMTQAPARPRERAPELDPRLEEIILAALAKDPARRPASAAEMRERLARIVPASASGVRRLASILAPARRERKA